MAAVRTRRRDWDAWAREQREAEERVRAKQRAYMQRPEVRAKRQAYQQAYWQAYRQRPEVRAKRQAYRQRPEVRAKQRAYMQRPEVRAKWQRLYNLVANLAHPKGDHLANDLEDEAHDLIRKLRPARAGVAV